MLRRLMQKLKNQSFSLRFCILSIFVVFSFLLAASLRETTHYLFMESMTSLSFDLMEQASTSTYYQIIHEMENTETKSMSSALLIKKGVVASKNQDEIVDYTTTIMQNEATLLPRVQSVYWGDEYGNFIIAQKESDGTITSEIINRSSNPSTHMFIYRNLQGNIIGFKYSNDFSYDPRNRPWYQAAKKIQHTTWLDVYQYEPDKHLGVSVSTPVYDDNKEFKGVVSFDIRLDYLQHLIEEINLTSHGVIFIVTREGKVVAFPGLKQSRNKSLVTIYALSTKPWIIQSFNQFMKTGERKFIFNYDNNDYLATYQSIFQFGTHEWLIGSVVPEKDFVGKLIQTHLLSMGIALFILLLGIITMSALISRVIRPLIKITSEIEKIKNFQLEDTKHINSRITEISSIADEMDAMKKSLRSFQMYVPAALVRQLIERGEDARIGGIKKPLTILFSDIQNFTSIAEQVDPDLLTKQMCDYFDALSKIIVSHQGTIDKYIGDAIMAFWGAPFPVNDPCQQAALAALNCIKKTNQLNATWLAEKKPPMVTRIGLHLGEAIVGNLGSSERLNYTAIGDAINLTSRLVDINKIYGTQIIVSETIYTAIKNQFLLRMVDLVILKGRAETSYIYELISEKSTAISYDLDRYNQLFLTGFNAYQQLKWDEAIKWFTQCKEINPQDIVAPIFIMRCEKFKDEPPPKNWNGTWFIIDK